MNQDIIAALTKSLAPVPARCAGVTSDREWTRQVKLAVCRVAKPDGATQPGVKIFANNCCTDDHVSYADDAEWLFDLVWAVEAREWGLEKLSLAMESEWGNRDHQKYDFQKLLVARAEIKLFVFQEFSPALIDEAIAEFREMIAIYRCGDDDEAYLFAGLCVADQPADHRFIFRQLTSRGELVREF